MKVLGREVVEVKGHYRLFNNSYKESYIHTGVAISGYHEHAIIVNFMSGTLSQ